MHPLPEEVRKAVEPCLDGSGIELALESDLGPDGSIGKQWLVTTKDRIYVVSPDHGSPSVVYDLPIKELSDLNAEALVGSGRLIANIRGDFIPLIRYSNSVAKEFSHVARRLQAMAKGEEPPATTDEDRTRRCPKCDFPLEVGSNACPNCVNRAQALKRLLMFVKPYQWMTITAVLLMILSQAMQLAPPYLTKILLDDVFGKAQKLGGHAGTAVRADLLRSLSLIVLALVLTRIVSMVIGIIQARLTASVGSHVIHDVRMKLYSSLERLTVGYFDKRQTGTVVSRVSQDTSSLDEFLAFDVPFISSNAVILLMVLGFMFQQNWQLTLITIIPAPIASFGASIIFKRVRWMFRRLWHRWSKLHGVMSDSLQGLRVVKAFAQEDREVGRFERRSRELFTANIQAEQTWATLMPITWFLLTSGQFIVWYFGGVGVIDGKVTVGTLIMFLSFIGMLYGPLQIMTRMWDWVGRHLSAAERVFEVMDAQTEETDPEQEVRLPVVKGRVHFRNVTFGYDKNRPVLHNIELDVQPGEMIGLVGHSGAGKSTMINLLCRFYTAQEGVIEIDGVDIRKINLADLRRQIGIVPQESYLFSGTIAENITYAKPDATCEEMIRAAKAANAHDFIVNFADGYETQVGERGQSLSGGERQRIAIARAVLHDPKVLILDEATSSVDTATEKQIQDALSRLIENRTTFAIAHRLSTLRNANRLLVLDQGKVAELGTHEELVAKNGTYAKLVNMQSELAGIVGVGG